MLKKNYRFHSRGGVRYTYQKGKTIRTPKLSLVYTKNIRNHQRFAVVISKKVIKSAVGRNQVRRRVYEAIRACLPEFTDQLDCIFVIFSADIRTMDFKELTDSVKNLLNQTKIA